MPIDQVVKMISGLEMDSESINSWKVGVERALKKYLPADQQMPEDETQQIQTM
jgi:ribonucleoside-diphosphate reductase alpha chain